MIEDVRRLMRLYTTTVPCCRAGACLARHDLPTTIVIDAKVWRSTHELGCRLPDRDKADDIAVE